MKREREKKLLGQHQPIKTRPSANPAQDRWPGWLGRGNGLSSESNRNWQVGASGRSWLQRW